MRATAIPLEGWKGIVRRALKRIGEDRILFVAAGVVFYWMLASVPAITAFVSIYALFSDGTSESQFTILASIVPPGAAAPIRDEFTKIAAAKDVQLGLTFVVSLLIALWGANGGMRATFMALDVACGVKEKRSFIRLNATALAMTAGMMIAAFVAVLLVVVFPLVMSRLGISIGIEAVYSVLRWVLLLATALIAMAILYHVGPNRTVRRWRWVTPGSLFAAIVWLVASAVLSLFMSDYDDYNAIYGTLGAVLGLMTWMWLTAIIVLVGAEIDSEVERELSGDLPPTVAPEMRRQ